MDTFQSIVRTLAEAMRSGRTAWIICDINLPSLYSCSIECNQCQSIKANSIAKSSMERRVDAVSMHALRISLISSYTPEVLLTRSRVYAWTVDLVAINFLYHERLATTTLFLCSEVSKNALANHFNGLDSLMFGFRKMKRSFNLSSTQSISLPIMLKSALLSIKTLTPSCSTASSKAPALSTYSK